MFETRSCINILNTCLQVSEFGTFLINPHLISIYFRNTFGPNPRYELLLFFHNFTQMSLCDAYEKGYCVKYYCYEYDMNGFF